VVHGKSHDAVKKAADDAMSKFKAARGAHDADIHFIGVWDTVDSVGGPFHIADVINTLIHRFKFPDHKLNEKIRCAVHALSIDDARAAFEPLLWEANQKVEQVWFAGVHANVGGGYPKQGMSLVALDWMIRKAGEHQLRVLSDALKDYSEHGNVDDKLYDSRAGLGVFYQWKPRDMRKLWETQKAGGAPLIHLSVLERIAHGTDGYAPGTLAPDVRVVYTSTGDPDQDKAAGIRAAAANAAVLGALSKGGADLNAVGGTLVIGQISYILYVVSCVAVFLAASVPADSGSRLNPWTILQNAATLIYDAVTGQWAPLIDAARRLLTDPALLGTLLLGLAISAALAYYVDRTRSAAFSLFWHNSRQDLRESLKAARLQAQSELTKPSPPSAAAASQ
jgi:hypothetical protein